MQEQQSIGSKPILMTRREFADPFGSDDDEETAPIKPTEDTEANRNIVNSTDFSKDTKNDIFSDLPKPNIVSCLNACNLIFFANDE